MTSESEIKGPTRAAGRANPRTLLRAVLFPLVVITLVASLLSYLYLAYVADPEENLHGFPIALVNMDVGDTIGTPEEPRQVNFGTQVADGIVAEVPADEIDLRVLGINEAQRQLRNGEVYGAIIIPGDFSKRLGILGVGSVVPGDIEQPIITVQTNPRVGPFATAIVTRIADRMLPQVNAQVGAQLTEQVEAQLAPPEGGEPTEISGAARLSLESPLRLVAEEFRPLPNGTGQGLTAFFFALLLLLVGVIGAMTIHTMADAALGFMPTEYGPWFLHFPPTPISRLRTLLLKWSVMFLAAVVIAGIFQLVAHALDMPLERPLALYLYSVLAITAVGVTGLSVLAAFGQAGLLVNLILFVVLGLPSSGGTVPIEATPTYFAWLATFEPMHQVYLAVRSILYFNADFAAGLGRGLWMTIFGLLAGMIFGLVVTKFYDYKGLHRSPAEPSEA
ncbi:MAG TPA: ABC transporter permease [Nocardia sp.]|uniref:ABC transporter permease n=1 Tax=Nocardia TaxID=1817 RepID=UPI002B4ABB12|nr:ABC transporter permease [Nocardia sp.]HLS77329.1 ABC transporter permease [Nocardia sp.]